MNKNDGKSDDLKEKAHLKKYLKCINEKNNINKKEEEIQTPASKNRIKSSYEEHLLKKEALINLGKNENKVNNLKEYFQRKEKDIKISKLSSGRFKITNKLFVPNSVTSCLNKVYDEHYRWYRGDNSQK